MAAYRVNLTRLPTSEAFCEATREELRVLLALVALDGSPIEKAELAKLCEVREARVGSALTLWQESGIIEPAQVTAEVIMDAWTVSEDRPIIVESKTELAESIRDTGIKDMIHECTKMMNRGLLGAQEIVMLTELVTDEGLSPEFILTLASHLLPKTSDGKKLTTKNLCKEARNLISLGIESLTELENYISDMESQKEYERAICRIVGRQSSKISQNERLLYARWVKDLGFGMDIIEEAFEVCNAITHKYSQKYMDSILESWFNAGCKTVEECRSFADKHREQMVEAARAKRAPRKKEQETDTAKYTVFDAEDVLMSALARSYGNEEN